MKKSIALLLTLVLSAGLFAACGNDSAGQPANETPVEESANGDTSGEGGEATEALYNIGIYQHVDHPSLNIIYEAMVARFEEQGYGDKINVDYKSGQGDATTLNTISQTFVADEKDVIVAIATNTAQSAAAATTDIPIVFAAVADPVGAKLVDSMDEAPTGNITGTSHAVPVADIFAMADILTPGIQTYGLVYNPGETSAQSTIAAAKEYLDANGIAYVEATISNTGELQQATLSLVGRADAIFVPNDNTVAAAMQILADNAAENGIPVYCSADTMVEDGGLATIGVDFAKLGAQTADMIIEILEGAPVSEVPPQKFTDFVMLVNTTTADKLDVDVSVLDGAELTAGN